MHRIDGLPYYDELHELASLILKCREDIVDDIVQETYIDIYEKYRIPLNLLSKETLINICRKRCGIAYSEMMKSPSKPLRSIKTDDGTIDPDSFIEAAAYRAAVYQRHSFEVNFKDVVAESELIELYGLNIKEEDKPEIIPEEKVRFSNKFIFEQVRHLWKKKRTKYLDSLIEAAENFKIKAIEFEAYFLDYLIEKRWNGIPECSKCGCDKSYKLSVKNMYKCKNCHRRYTIISESVFSVMRIPLAVFFSVIKSYMLSDCQKLNSLHGSKISGITQKSMWWLMQKVYENVEKISDNEFSIKGIKNTFLISEIDDLLKMLSVDMVEIPTTLDCFKSRKIVSIDSNGIKKEFDSIQLASKELLIDYRRIRECVVGDRSDIGGYRFKAA